MGGQPSSKLSITVFSAEMMISKEWRSKSFSLVDLSRGSSSIRQAKFFVLSHYSKLSHFVQSAQFCSQMSILYQNTLFVPRYPFLSQDAQFCPKCPFWSQNTLFCPKIPFLSQDNLFCLKKLYSFPKCWFCPDFLKLENILSCPASRTFVSCLSY